MFKVFLFIRSSSTYHQSTHRVANKSNMPDSIANTATYDDDDDDEDYDCFTKAKFVTVTRIDQRTYCEETGKKTVIGIKDSYRIDANIAGDHVRKYAQTWGSQNKDRVCVKSFLYPTHVGTEDPAPKNGTATYGRVVPPRRHRLGDPLRFRPPLKVNRRARMDSQPTEVSVGDGGATIETKESGTQWQSETANSL